MAPPYVGTSVVILAVVGAFARGTRLPRRFAIIVALFCVLKFTGVPLLNDVGRLPGLSMLIFYKYGNPALACALAAAACHTPEPGIAGERRITPGSTDWRDEVIYQVFVDRFANGDYSNDFGVDCSPSLSPPPVWPCPRRPPSSTRAIRISPSAA